jgi:DNA-directed RNA polymerase specialized sigma24 family protein
VVRLRYFSALSYDQISALCGISLRVNIATM